MGDNPEDKASKNKGPIMYFGLRDRYCPGNPVANLEMQIITSLMANYNWIRREKVNEWKTMTIPVPDNELWVCAISLEQ